MTTRASSKTFKADTRSVRGKHTRNPGYERGGHWVVCDVCGCDIRNYDAKLRWDNLVCCPDDWEPRHEQDFVRGRADDTAAKGLVRPEVEGVSILVTYAENTDHIPPPTFGNHDPLPDVEFLAATGGNIQGYNRDGSDYPGYIPSLWVANIGEVVFAFRNTVTKQFLVGLKHTAPTATMFSSIKVNNLTKGLSFTKMAGDFSFSSQVLTGTNYGQFTYPGDIFAEEGWWAAAGDIVRLSFEK